MKKNFKNPVIATALIATIGVCLLACKKDNSTTTSTSATVTEADAVQMTSDAVEPSTGGMTVEVNSSVALYKVTAISCGVPKDTTIAVASASGTTPTYNASLSWEYVLNCAGVSPSTMTLTFKGNTDYTGTKMSLSGTSSGSFTLGGLAVSSTSYTLNSTYTRSGSTTSTINGQHTYTSNLQITSTNITVDKTTGAILSGTGSVSITGTSSTGSSFSFGGTITFLGGNSANLVLNSGTKYLLQW